VQHYRDPHPHVVLSARRGKRKDTTQRCLGPRFAGFGDFEKAFLFCAVSSAKAIGGESMILDTEPLHFSATCE
jgi:hypothetical protein